MRGGQPHIGAKGERGAHRVGEEVEDGRPLVRVDSERVEVVERGTRVGEQPEQRVLRRGEVLEGGDVEAKEHHAQHLEGDLEVDEQHDEGQQAGHG